MAVKRKKSKPEHREDRERVQAARAESTPTSFWARVRAHYPQAVQDIVDPLVELSTLSLRDLLTLELAEHESLQAMIRDAYDNGEGLRSIAAMSSTALQSRKNARVLVLAMGVGTGLSDQPVRLPEGVVFELPADDDNLGDEIVN